MRFSSFKIAAASLLGCLFSLHAASSLPRGYSFGFTNGNLIRNWSFEDRGSNWFEDPSTNPRYQAKSTNISAVSGSFVARFVATEGHQAVYNSLISDYFPIEPNAQYNLSLYVQSTGMSASSTIRPVVWFYSDKGNTYLGPGFGEYFPLNSSWVLQSASFNSPDRARFARVALIEAQPGDRGTFYLDDIILEKGGAPTPRVQINEALVVANDLGQPVQNFVKVAGGGSDAPSRKYIVQANEYDDSRRLTNSYGAYVKSGTPDYDPDYYNNSKNYNNGTNGKGSLGSNPSASVQYYDEPGAQVANQYAAADAWNTKAMRSDWYYRADLSFPTDIENPGPDNTTHNYVFAWSKDVNGNYTITWTNEKGQVVKRSVKTPTRTFITYFEYFPDGRLKKALTPFDDFYDENHQDFREVTNYNSHGDVTSVYTKDRGLKRFWNNRQGQLRFSQHESQESTHEYNFIDYDPTSRPIRFGTQIIETFSPELADEFSTSSANKNEMQGLIYDNLNQLQNRTGISLTEILPGVTLAVHGEGRVVCSYRFNNEVGLGSYGLKDRFVATFYNYNEYGEITEVYKFIGPIKTASEKVHKAVYTYDQMHRLSSVDLYDSKSSPTLLSRHSYSYDALSRISKVLGIGGKFISSYSYYDWGELKSVVLGGTGTTGTGTQIEFNYHAQGWLKEIKATRLETGDVTFQQMLGYESKVYDHANVPSTQAAFDGRITQQLYKFADDISALGPVRLFNYGYDALNRMTSAEFKKNNSASALGSHQQISFDNLQFIGASEMDSHLTYDDIGRILIKQEGVAAGDAATYTYQSNSYRLEKVAGKFDLTSQRDASVAGTFVYDERGRLAHDESQKMDIHYGWDDMPTEFRIHAQDGSSKSEFCFYDAEGNRVSRVMAEHTADEERNALSSFVVGSQETSEPVNMYAFDGLTQAYSSEKTVVSSGNDAKITDVVFHVVPNRGQSEVNPSAMDVVAFSKLNATAVPLELDGVIKDSPDHQALVTNALGGTSLSSVNDLNVLGPGDERWHEEYDADGNITSSKAIKGIFGRGDVIGRVTPEGDYEYYLKNNLGSTMRTVSENGDYSSSNTLAGDYLAYGSLNQLKVGSVGTEELNQLFTGKEFEKETKLYAFGARWMDPQLGVFTTPDPAGQFFNPYSYTGGDPINLVDPDGLNGEPGSGISGCTGGCGGGGGGGGGSTSGGTTTGPNGEIVFGAYPQGGFGGFYVSSGGGEWPTYASSSDFPSTQGGPQGGPTGSDGGSQGGYGSGGSGGSQLGYTSIGPPGLVLNNSAGPGLQSALPEVPYVPSGTTRGLSHEDALNDLGLANGALGTAKELQALSLSTRSLYINSRGIETSRYFGRNAAMAAEKAAEDAAKSGEALKLSGLATKFGIVLSAWQGADAYRSYLMNSKSKDRGASQSAANDVYNMQNAGISIGVAAYSLAALPFSFAIGTSWLMFSALSTSPTNPIGIEINNPSSSADVTRVGY